MTEDPAQQCRALVLKFFDGDDKKTDLWFDTANPHLGQHPPSEMIAEGRVEKLLAWIKGQLEGNGP